MFSSLARSRRQSLPHDDDSGRLHADTERRRVLASSPAPEEPAFYEHPGTILLVCSIPFCLGAYFGTRQSKRMEAMMMEDEAHMAAATATDRSRALGLATASRALKVATFSTIGAFGMFGAVTFYAMGYRRMEDAVQETKAWATRNRMALEEWLDSDNLRSTMKDPEVVATRNMKEDEELKYLYDTYLKQEVDESVEAYEKENGSDVEEE